MYVKTAKKFIQLNLMKLSWICCLYTMFESKHTLCLSKNE